MDISAEKFKPSQVIDYWFSPQMSEHWFNSTREIDADLARRFGALWRAAANGEYDHWLETPEGTLAMIIVLDQIPLNIFRGKPISFSTEARAREISRHAIDNDLDKEIQPTWRIFIYLPYSHSENLADQDYAVYLVEGVIELRKELPFTKRHREIVKRFGRFPHRNKILGRASTPEEIEWLESPEAFKG